MHFSRNFISSDYANSEYVDQMYRLNLLMQLRPFILPWLKVFMLGKLNFLLAKIENLIQGQIKDPRHSRPQRHNESRLNLSISQADLSLRHGALP